MDIIKNPVKLGDKTWQEFTLINDAGMSVKFLDLGGIITEINVPDRLGLVENVVLAYDDYSDYLKNPPFLGALIGRVAGRIENASFTLNDQTFELPKNDGNHSLHGGPEGLHVTTFKVEPIKHADRVAVILYHTSEAGEAGYPGTVSYKITYTLTQDNTFEIAYEAISDEDTVLTLTNHSYFNLSGDLKETILNHELTLDASQIAELDDELIPTGRLLPVLGTPFDFTLGQKLLAGVNSSDPQNKVANDGYDHFFLLDHLNEASAILKDEASGRQMTVKTDQPGVVMYGSTTLGDAFQLKSKRSEKYLGICLETQSSPGSLVHDNLPSIELKANDVYRSKTSFTFDAFITPKS